MYENGGLEREREGKMIEIEKKTVSWRDYLILCLRGVFEGTGGVQQEGALWRFTQERPA